MPFFVLFVLLTCFRHSLRYPLLTSKDSLDINCLSPTYATCFPLSNLQLPLFPYLIIFAFNLYRDMLILNSYYFTLKCLPLLGCVYPSSSCYPSPFVRPYLKLLKLALAQLRTLLLRPTLSLAMTNLSFIELCSLFPKG